MRSDGRRAARESLRFHGRGIGLVLALAAGLLSACGGSDDPPDQTPPARAELTGYATADGSTLETADISVKGATGPSRTNSFSGNPAQSYSVTTEQATAPFMLEMRNVGVVSVATADGRANVTPLTHLLAIALFGQSPVDAFNDYGDASAAQIALINDAEIQRAQADATDFLEHKVKVTVRSGDASFITTAFEPVEGDPMWDTLADLNARIAKIGPETYGALVAGFTQRQHACRLARVELAIGGSTTRFCPATTTSTPEASDPSVLDHVFSQTTGETLTLRVRGDAVVDATFVTAQGSRYACSGSGCAGIALDPAVFDTTRSVTLTSVVLGRATATGHLTTTIPNVTLPDLPCFVGYVHKIGAEGSVASECADNSSALQLLNVSGTLGAQEGASSYADYGPYGAAGVGIVLNGAELVSITAMVTSADGSSSITAECRGADCRGVTIGEATVNMNLGIQTDTRTVTLDGTVLRAVAADGSLTMDTPVRLKASLRLIYYSYVDYGYAMPDDPPNCTGSSVVARLTPDDTPQWEYLVCFDGGPGPVYSTPLDGGLEIAFNGLTIDTDADGRVVRARVLAYHTGNSLGESFGCDGLDDCHGVQFSARGAPGNGRITIDGATFRNVAPDGFASGPRTGRVGADFDVVPIQ